MTKEIPWYRSLQKIAIQNAEKVADKASELSVKAHRGLKELDNQFEISTNTKNAGKKIAEVAQQTDEKFDISAKASDIKQAVVSVSNQTIDLAVRISEKTELNKYVGQANDALKTHFAEPAEKLIKKHALDRRWLEIADRIENKYGDIRSIIKPYFVPESAAELLINTKRELTYISACIMQINAGESEKLAGQFGAAIASKIAGAATVGGVFALVSAFGTAGTGTAIASLSGAAATSATLAWVGSLLGGGMATGAVLTGGLGIVVGLAAYKTLGSERRPFEQLSELEQRIVQSSWVLIAMIDDFLRDETGVFKPAVAQDVLDKSLLPLQSMLVENADSICMDLDRKHAVAFRQHVLIDYQRVVINGFAYYIESKEVLQSHGVEYLVGGVFYALLSRTAVDGSEESQLVLDALRRSDNSLVDASESQLSDYLSSYDAEQLKGIANNVKGIYHEQLWVHHYNATHTDTYAQMFDATNHVGSDVEIRDSDTDQIINAYQLKATGSAAYVNHHLDRYPDTDVLVTSETAERMGSVQSSGISNDEITGKVTHDLDAIATNTIDDRVLNSAEVSAAIAAGHGLIEMLRGEKDFPQSAIDAAKRVGAASTATAITAYLFS